MRLSACDVAAFARGRAVQAERQKQGDPGGLTQGAAGGGSVARMAARRRPRLVKAHAVLT